jgi:hypothetical protein
MSRAKRQFAGDAAQRSITSYFNPVSTTATTTTAAAAVPSRPSELMPFCGIHKTGGLDSAVPALDAVPGLSYSQESTVAIDEDSWGGRAIATSRKRLNDDDELELEDEDEAEGNRILVPPHAVNGTEYLAAGRTIAIPRRRKTVTAADDDFEEAQFLDIAGMR